VDVDALDVVRRRQPQQRDEVALVRMHTARPNQPHQVELAIVALDVLDGLEQRGIAEERAVDDRRGHARVLLQHALAGSDVEVSHLGVAHLALRQPDRWPRRLELRVWPLTCEAVQMRRGGQRDGVGLAAWIDPPAVHHDQD
jgi:hypothetical protein